MPDPVLAVYSSLVTHIGSNLAFVNATEYQVQPLDDDIGKCSKLDICPAAVTLYVYAAEMKISIRCAKYIIKYMSSW